MVEEDDDAWFRPKRYGYGGGLPIRWQGWALIAVTAALLWLAKVRLHGWEQPAGYAAALALFFGLCALKTRGGWRWRWGGK